MRASERQIFLCPLTAANLWNDMVKMEGLAGWSLRGATVTHSANRRARVLPDVNGIRAAWSFAIILANADHLFGLCLGAYGLSHPPLKRFTRDAK